MSSESILLMDFQGCTGHMKWGPSSDEELPIAFDLKIEKNGRGTIEFNTSDPKFIAPISTLHHNTATFGVRAIDADGNSIDVTEAIILSSSIGASNIEQCHKISATIKIIDMSIIFTDVCELSEGEPKQQAEYFVKGLARTLGFSSRLAPWTVSVSSEEKTEYPDTISARMVVALDNSWKEMLPSEFGIQCDELVQRLLEVLSVAVGTSLAWSVRRIYIEKLPIELSFRSTQVTDAPAFPLFYSLNLSPILGLALASHTPEIRHARGLDVAIYWYLIYSHRAEAQYLHLMTALEHMISRYNDGRSKARFDKLKFKREVKPALLAAATELKKRSEISDADFDFLKGKLGDLNRMSLRDDLEGMLTEWGVQFEDLLQVAQLRDLIEVRNRITHSGAISRQGDEEPYDLFWQCFDVLIELLKRVFMAVWGYQGRYISHFGSYHEAEYPPKQHSDPED